MDQLTLCWAVLFLIGGVLSSCGTPPIGDSQRAALTENLGALTREQIEVPPPVLITHEHGWGTGTPLSDGTIITAKHIFWYFPTKFNGCEYTSFDTVRRGSDPPTNDELAPPHRFCGDWIQFRIRPWSEQGWKYNRDAMVASHPSAAPGDVVTISGYSQTRNDPPQPVLCTIRARIIAPPQWIQEAQDGCGLLFARAIDPHPGGMSGSPVTSKRDSSIGPELIGIYLGHANYGFLGFGEEVLVIHPWPPGDGMDGQSMEPNATKVRDDPE